MTGRGPRRVDQEMAATAARMLPPQINDTLRTRYRQLPVWVRTAGLAATCAYLVGKTDDRTLGQAYQKVASGIRHHLTERRALIDPVRCTSDEELITALGEMSAASYARAAAEVEVLAGWLSRLAEARYQAAKATVGGAGREADEPA